MLNHPPLRHFPLACLAFGASLAAQDLQAPPATVGLARDPVVFDQPGDGRLWAVGATYKASFGAEGFVYVPFFGSAAPRNHPVHFVLRAVRVGGRDLPFTQDAAPVRAGTRVTFDRGAVREVYELTGDGVEQVFVVDGDRQGDVEVELQVVTDLVEDATRPGLQFGNALGHVTYGTAYLVDGAHKSEIPVALHDHVLRLSVPAAQRVPGAVVIDPVIRTEAMTPTQMASDNPDIAYDATTDRYLATWVHVFSQADHDVVAELRTGDGRAVPGSFKLLDPTTTMFTWPRVANLASADRFLVTMERFRPDDPPGRQYTVWGRTIDAASPFVTSGQIQINSASTTNENNADVGGDPGSGTNWLVVWVSGENIVGKLVSADGVPSPVTIPIDTGSRLTIHPQVSLSNGNGLTPRPRWCVAYQLRATEVNWDVYAAAVDLAGTVVVPPRQVASAGNDLYPHVSSPLTDAGDDVRYLIIWERLDNGGALIARLATPNLSLSNEFDLTRRYGFSRTYSRVDSDGSRFAVTCRIGDSLRIGTLAWVADDLVQHDVLQNLGPASMPYIASKRSGGGPNTDYGVVLIAPQTPPRAAITFYEGRPEAGGWSIRPTNCGLGINSHGRPSLGNVVEFALGSTGTDLAGVLLGIPHPAILLCSTCRLGLDPTQALIPFPTPMSLRLPNEPRFVGVTLSVQGFALGSGPCAPAQLRLSDTIDFTIQ